MSCVSWFGYWIGFQNRFCAQVSNSLVDCEWIDLIYQKSLSHFSLMARHQRIIEIIVVNMYYKDSVFEFT